MLDAPSCWTVPDGPSVGYRRDAMRSAQRTALLPNHTVRCAMAAKDHADNTGLGLVDNQSSEECRDTKSGETDGVEIVVDDRNVKPMKRRLSGMWR